MKKFLVALLFAALVLPIFADDAMVLPTGVFRITTAPSFASESKAYDSSGKLKDTNAFWANNLGLALEYGANDWISAAIQWAPGWTYASHISGTNDANLNGVYDMFAGAKFQIVGEKAPVQSDTMRFAVATGLVVPFSGPNYADQAKNAAKGDAYTVINDDHHVLGLGGRGYFDYIFTKFFYVNLYTQFIDYPVKGNYEDASLLNYETAQFIKGMGGLAGPTPSKIDYGYNFTFETEPTFLYPVYDWVSLGGSLPIDFKCAPDQKVDGTAVGHTGWTTWTINPTLEAFFTTAFPVDLKLQYLIPLAGTNTQATSAFAIQVKTFLKF
jgi:hypothetical protein